MPPLSFSLLLAALAVTAPTPGASPGQAIELQSKKQAQAVQSAIDACKADATRVAQALDALVAGQPVGAAIGTRGRSWQADIRTLNTATQRWGQRPAASKPLLELARAAATLTASLPKANAKLTSSQIAALKNKSRVVRDKQDAVMGILEPVIHR